MGTLALAARRRLDAKRAMFFVSLLFVDLMVIGQWFGLEALVERLEQSNPQVEARWADYSPLLMAYLQTLSLDRVRSWFFLQCIWPVSWWRSGDVAGARA